MMPISVPGGAVVGSSVGGGGAGVMIPMSVPGGVSEVVPPP